MWETRTPLQVNQAVNEIMEQIIEGKTEVVSITECDQRYLGADILSTHEVPLFTRSGFDGYALRSMDTLNAPFNEPIELKVLEELGAGMVAAKDIGPFEW